VYTYLDKTADLVILTWTKQSNLHFCDILDFKNFLKTLKPKKTTFASPVFSKAPRAKQPELSLHLQAH